MEKSLSKSEIYNRLVRFIDTTKDVGMLRCIALELIDNNNNDCHLDSYYNHEKVICKKLNLKPE